MRRLGKAHNLRYLLDNERGGTLAELAIILPVLVVMIAAVSEVGRYFQTYTTLSKATRSAARYLSNHQFNPAEKDRAKSLVLCGKLNCTGEPALVKGLTVNNICIQTTMTAALTVETVTVSIPRQNTVCEDGATATRLLHQPIFDIGALLQSNTFTFNYPISPATTMRYIPAD
jgi:Flp pilus assembly protein TadG